MLKLRDFLHLPQLDPLFEGIAAGEPGLVVIAGFDSRPTTTLPAGDILLASGRSTIFSILMQEIIEGHPGLRATIVARDRSVAQVPRQLKYRVVNAPVEP